MKRMLAAMIAVLLLAGCATDAGGPTGSSTVDTGCTDPTAPSVYTGVSRIRAETEGRIDAYVLPTLDYTGMAFFEGNILLFSQNGSVTTLTMVSAEDLSVRATAALDCALDPNSTQIRFGSHRIGYYDSSAGVIVFLDNTLRETGQVELPEDIMGLPVMSEDLERIYYCTASDIRVLDLQTGISRLLKQHTCAEQSLRGLCFDETVLVCTLTDADGDVSTAYISTKNGAALLSEPGEMAFYAYEDRYFAPRINGTAQELLFGVHDGETRNLIPAKSHLSVQPVLELDGVVAFPEENGCFGMDFYDLSTGKRTASVMLPAMVFPGQLLGQAGNTSLWFLAHDQQTQENVLCHWDLSGSTLSDETVYANVHYTADSPDEAGLAQANARANELGDAYGLDIRIWQDAVSESCGLVLEPEYQVSAILRELQVLENALSRFPEDFFRQLAAGTSNGALHLCIVRSIQNGNGSLSGAQAWLKSESFLYLAAGSGLEQSFYHQLSHAIDSRVLVESTLYDDWKKLNPEGFNYDSRYDIALGNTDPCPYPDAFIDTYAMASAADDRASVFEYAMRPDASYAFSSEIMQSKLLRMCRAIRDAFGMKKYTEILPWEQYLSESIAYSKK